VENYTETAMRLTRDTVLAAPAEIEEDIDDLGYQAPCSTMLVPEILQAYAGGSEIRGLYGKASGLRAGLNWCVMKQRGLRLNAEWIHLNQGPVGYTAVPHPVEGNGDVYHLNFGLNF
jgi:hypothetical protein